jgi:hypothetical protein
LSQSSLEVRSFFLYLSLFWNLIRESRGSIWRSGNICHPLLPLSLSLSLSRLIIFWRSSHLSFDPRFRLRLTVINISFTRHY